MGPTGFHIEETVGQQLNRLPTIFNSVFPSASSIESYLKPKVDSAALAASFVALDPKDPFIIPVVTRKYKAGRLVTLPFEAEFFNLQYRRIKDLAGGIAIDVADQKIRYKIAAVPNSRARLRLPAARADVEKTLTSRTELRYYRRKFALTSNDISSPEGLDLVTATVARFNQENLGQSFADQPMVEVDFFSTKIDPSRRYFGLYNSSGCLAAINELQFEVLNGELTVFIVNTYYAKNQDDRKTFVGLIAMYKAIEDAASIARELGFAEFEMDLGVVFGFAHKFKIPGTQVRDKTIVLQRI